MFDKTMILAVFILVIIGFAIAIIDGDNGNKEIKEPIYPRIPPKVHSGIVEVCDVIYVPAREGMEITPENRAEYSGESIDLNLKLGFSVGSIKLPEVKKHVRISESFAVITIHNGQKLVFQGERNRNLFSVANKGQYLKLSWIFDRDNAICQSIGFLEQDNKEIKQ